MAKTTVADMMGEELSAPPPPNKPAKEKVVRLKQPATSAKDATAEAVPVQIEKVTLYLPKPVYRYIKQKALDFDRKPHDLLIEGIEMLLRKDGKTIAALIGK